MQVAELEVADGPDEAGQQDQRALHQIVVRGLERSSDQLDHRRRHQRRSGQRARRGAQLPRVHGSEQDEGHDPAQPGGRHDRVRGGGVARHRRAVDQGVVVGAVDGPAADGSAHGQPPRPRSAARRLGLPICLLGERSHRVVGIDDERGQQGVPARVVAVERRRRHAQLAGDGAQRQRCRSAVGQVLPGHRLDHLLELGPGPLASVLDGGHAAESASGESTGPGREHCS